MPHETLLVGPLTRDFTDQEGLRWSQPGGAVWHASLALTSDGPDEAVAVRAWGTAGPWALRYGAPVLAAAGVEWSGVRSAADTVFRNRYRSGGRRQSLVSRAEPLEIDRRNLGPVDAAVVSPLLADDLPASLIAGLRDGGAFVGLDAQGLLRTVGTGGRVGTRSVDLREWLADARAVKFSEREFGVFSGLDTVADWSAAAIEVARRFDVEVLVSGGAQGAAVALAGGELVGPSSPAEVRGADTTGAGDVLIAEYVVGRSRGLLPGQSLQRAVERTQVLLQRRPRTRAGTAGPAELIGAVRELQAAAEAMRRRVRRGAAPAGSFAEGGVLASALQAHFARALLLSMDPAERGAALVGACWALFTRGWPPDPALSAAALRAVAAEERE